MKKHAASEPRVFSIEVAHPTCLFRRNRLTGGPCSIFEVNLITQSQYQPSFNPAYSREDIILNSGPDPVTHMKEFSNFLISSQYRIQDTGYRIQDA